MRVPFTVVEACDLRPGMRLYHPGLRAGWTVTGVKHTQVYDDDRSYEDRTCLKFDDEASFTAYRPTHRFRVIGRRAKPGHEHHYEETFSVDNEGHYTVFAGHSCTQCGEPL